MRLLEEQFVEVFFKRKDSKPNPTLLRDCFCTPILNYRLLQSINKHFEKNTLKECIQALKESLQKKEKKRIPAC